MLEQERLDNAQRRREVAEEKRQLLNYKLRLHGRAYDGVFKNEDNGPARMRDSLDKTHSSVRDRVLHGLEVDRGDFLLASEVLDAKLVKLEEREAKLKAERRQLTMQRTKARRDEEDARLLHRGDVVRRWAEKDARVREALRVWFNERLRTPRDFQAVGLPFPESLRGSAPEQSPESPQAVKGAAEASKQAPQGTKSAPSSQGVRAAQVDGSKRVPAASAPSKGASAERATATSSRGGKVPPRRAVPAAARTGAATSRAATRAGGLPLPKSAVRSGVTTSRPADPSRKGQTP